MWGDLSADFKECKLGKEESPIDISTKATVKEKLPALGFNYKMGAAVVFNNGHTVQVNLIDAGSAKLAGGDYSLLQFHFHTPIAFVSEEDPADFQRRPGTVERALSDGARSCRRSES